MQRIGAQKSYTKGEPYSRTTAAKSERTNSKKKRSKTDEGREEGVNAIQKPSPPIKVRETERKKKKPLRKKVDERKREKKA